MRKMKMINGCGNSGIATNDGPTSTGGYAIGGGVEKDQQDKLQQDEKKTQPK